LHRHPNDGILDRLGVGDDEAGALRRALETHAPERKLWDAVDFAFGCGEPKTLGTDILTRSHDDWNDDAQRLTQCGLLRDRAEPDR
jgi:hypothetical protein